MIPTAGKKEDDVASTLKIQQCDSGMSLMEAQQIQNKLVDYNKKVFSIQDYNNEYKANLITLKDMGFLNFEKNYLTLSQTGNQLETAVLKLSESWTFLYSNWFVVTWATIFKGIKGVFIYKDQAKYDLECLVNN